MTKLLSVVLCLMLAAALALGMTACTNDREGDTGSGISSTETAPTRVGQGATEFAFSVTDKDGNVTEFTVCTDKTIVGEALQEAGLIEGEDSEYGLFVKKVNGITADYNTDGTYWAFYVDGGYALKGADQTEIAAGSTYAFKVEK